MGGRRRWNCLFEGSVLNLVAIKLYSVTQYTYPIYLPPHVVGGGGGGGGGSWSVSITTAPHNR